MKDSFYDIVSYNIYTKKLKKNEIKKVVLIADIHGYTKNIKRSNNLVEAIIKLNPHHVVIAGDIMQGKKWIKENNFYHFANFLKKLSKEIPVFISQGNHDIANLNEKEKETCNLNFKNLQKINPKMIFPLINDKVYYDGFEILGYTPRYETISKLSIQEHGLAHDAFIHEYAKNGPKIDDSKDIVEFVGHSPHLIARSENGIGLECLKNVDTFYTGHLHNGYRRSSTIEKNPDKYLDFGYEERFYSKDKNGKIIKKSINPLLFSKSSLCRGIVYIDDSSKKRVLQLRNNHFYINNSEKWNIKDVIDARKIINDNHLHALVITGGIRNFLNIALPGDYPEITEINYIGEK